MLEIKSPINENKNFDNLSLKEKTPILKLNIRGKPNNKDFTSAIGKILGIILPLEVGNIVSKENISIITTGPNEWLIISNNIDDIEVELEKILFKTISINNLGAVTNITDQFTIFSLKGSKTLEILSRSSPFDFESLPNNFSAQTILNNIDITVVKKNNENIDLLVRRSFSNHLWSWLNDSARFL
jgi:sarcosine oxidase, subunit gamma